MTRFSALELYKIARFLEAMSNPNILAAAADPIVTEESMDAMLDAIGPVALTENCEKLGLKSASAQLQRIESTRSKWGDMKNAPVSVVRDRMKQIQLQLRELQERIQDEVKHISFFYIPSDDAELYDASDRFFRTPVERIWPNLFDDGRESLKCFALSRYTASVFHLMRIMEFAVQKLGDKLGVKLTEEKNWHNILNEVNKAIKSLDQKLAETKKLAAASANLYNVKLAWRNEVMHPKATYTKEEAKRILDSVRSFVEDLISVL